MRNIVNAMTISKFQPSTEMFHQQVFTGPCLITSLSLHSPKFFVLNVLNGLDRVSFYSVISSVGYVAREDCDRMTDVREKRRLKSHDI